jgi:serine/threonine protein kinase
MEPPRSVGQWLLEGELGRGSFAVVWRARHAATGAPAAVKEINTDKLNKKLQESLASEVAVLSQTKHRNIVGLLDLFKARVRLALAPPLHGRMCASARLRCKGSPRWWGDAMVVAAGSAGRPGPAPARCPSAACRAPALIAPAPPPPPPLRSPQDGSRIFLVLEFCAGGDLGLYLRRYGRVSEATARYFLVQLAEGLKELRRHNVIHVRRAAARGPRRGSRWCFGGLSPVG